MKLPRPSISDALGFFLFGITAIYSVEYFMSGTANTWDAVKAAGMAVAFESAKIVLWRRGWTTHNVLFLFVSIPFFCISFIAAGGASMIYLSKSTDTAASVEAANLQVQIDQVDKQIGLLQKRLDAVASDPNAPTASLRNELDKDMDARGQLSTKQGALKTDQGSNASGADMVMGTLSGWLGISKTRFELIYMLSRAILLEVGAMAATTPILSRRRKRSVIYMRSARIPIAHIMKPDGLSTLCGVPLLDPVVPTETTPICAMCVNK